MNINPLFKLFYKLMFYFELGKNQVARLYQFFPDMFIILGGLKYLFGLDLQPLDMFIVLVIMIFVCTCAGYLFKKTGLLAIDRYTVAERDPVWNDLLSAARKINRRYR